ncbi:TOM1-like protein 1 isoform X1 [Centrocercus urophasianus]|uniref:TOM1-like protein 1 isoform X1 n=2 Tax=Centrocercus urophasianus TaxID=9002 RepID=UPI001C645DEF|nr:TOM1-like protein 1 isoform X1 [Centrocercus urophasianus]
MAFGKAPKDPFGTAVGSLVDRATFGSLQTEEWGQFMHICDVINATEEGPKDAVKALKKKLSKNCNHKEIRLTLSLLDMCMQNCGPRFQSLVVKKDFCKDKLVKLLNPRYNLPIELQEKILTFIMIWARGFQGMVDVTEVKEVYLELLKKGVEFPSSATSKERSKQSPSSAKSSPSSANPPKRSLLPLPTGPTLLLIPEQIGKLYSELDMAKMNVRVMSSILKENVPGSENPDDMNLLQKLYKTCRMMQERIMELLVTVENEDVIIELIQVNEDLNNVLLGHERFSRNRVRFLENQRIQREREELYRKQPSAPSSDLLDFSTDSPSPVAAVLGTDPAALQFPSPNSISAHPEDTKRLHPSIYPQLDLAAAVKVQQFPFATEAQNNSVSTPAGHTYSNLATLLSPVPLNPVNLQAGHTTSSSGPSPPAASKNKLQTPHYYEIMEFDPLAPTEAIYEEIDAAVLKPEAEKHSEC